MCRHGTRRRHFHASPRADFFWKLSALGAGFFLRLFYKELSPAHKELIKSKDYWKTILTRSPRLAAFTAITTTGIGAFVWASHDKTPITHRSRFIWTNRTELLDYAGAVQRLIDRTEGRQAIHASTETYKYACTGCAPLPLCCSMVVSAVSPHPVIPVLQARATHPDPPP